MKEIFSGLKKKPEREKNRILYWTTFLIMLAVVVFWFLSFPSRFNGNSPAAGQITDTAVFNSIKNMKNSTQEFLEGVITSGQNYFK